LLRLFPPHHKYVEVFFGGGALFFRKQPSPLEVINDIDDDVFNLYSVLRQPKLFRMFKRLTEATLHCRATFDSCQGVLESPTQKLSTEEQVKRAWMFFVRCRQAYSGKPGQSWRYDRTGSARGMAKTTANWCSAVERLPQIHARLRRTLIENNDFERLIAIHDGPETFFYLDPPYVTSSRVHKKEYRHEMTDEDHQRLVNQLLSIEGMAALSGYATSTSGAEHGLYRELEDNGWRRIAFDVACPSGTPNKQTGKRPRRTEVLWLCPKCVERLGGGRELSRLSLGTRTGKKKNPLRSTASE